MYHKLKYIRGLTLIELMFSLAISLLILTALTDIYIAAQKNLSFQIALNTNQVNAQTATEFLKRDIASAGFIGCAKLNTNFPVVNHTGHAINKISGSSETVTVQHMNTDVSTLASDMRNNSVLYIKSNQSFKSGEVMLISDCLAAELFSIYSTRLLNNSITEIISTVPLVNHFNTNAQIARLEENTYYIQKSALRLRNINHHNDELVEGVESMHLTYDVSISNKIITTNEISDGSSVRGINIYLRMTTTDPKLKKDWYLYVAIA